MDDEVKVAEVTNSRAFSEFCGVNSSNHIPDGDIIGRLRKILVENGLQEKLIAQVIDLLQQRGLVLNRNHCGFHPRCGAVVHQNQKR